MILTKAAKRNLLLLVAAFFLCGALRILLYRVDFTFGFSSVFCCALTILWAAAVQKRVTDRRLRLLMLWSAVFLLLHFVCQMSRYDIFADNATILRYLWYFMYIPMTAQPLLFFFLAV